jgi:hypothetical protein
MGNLCPLQAGLNLKMEQTPATFAWQGNSRKSTLLCGELET